MNYYISDLHLGHANCLAFDNRQFKDVEEQDKIIIRNWNSRVKPEDDVYCLGDFSWYSPQKTVEVFKKLNGKIHLIVGNHDKKLLQNKSVRDLFVEITDYKELYLDNKQGVVLCHYPIPCYNKHFYGWYHLYGHVHNSFEWNMMKQIKYQMEALYTKKCEMYNVGCMIDYINYTPRTLDEILKDNKGENANEG